MDYLMQKTYIPGKDVALEDTIDFFQTQLAKLGFDIEEASWLNPVPHVWSVHIRDKSSALCFTNGKGSTQKAALASALGEFFERLSTNYFFADFYLGNDINTQKFVHYPNEKWFPLEKKNLLYTDLLDNKLRSIYVRDKELDQAGLVDMQSSNNEKGICALPFTRFSDKETVYIPVNIIANLYVSNGMSAGNNLVEAQVQGLSEIFERYVKNRVISEKIALPKIPSDITNRYPKIEEAIKTLESEGFPIYSFDASFGGLYPVVAVVLFNPENGGCFASFGAHPNFEVAYERAVTELLQGRSLQSLDVFPSPTFDDEEVSDYANLETHFIDSSGVLSWDLFSKHEHYEFTEWNFAGTTESELNALVNIVKLLNSDVYFMHYNHLGVDACRIIVPGISEIYQPDDLIYANNNMGIHLRDTILSLPSMSINKRDMSILLANLDELDLDETIRVRELLGIATGSQTAWNTLRVGELKAMLNLAIGETEEALSWVEWTIDFNQSTFTPERMRYYRCLHTLLLLSQEPNRHFDEYEVAFKDLFGQEYLTQALDALNGIQPFNGLLFEGEKTVTLNSFKTHMSLLDAYEKLQRAKIATS